MLGYSLALDVDVVYDMNKFSQRWEDASSLSEYTILFYFDLFTLRSSGQDWHNNGIEKN